MVQRGHDWGEEWGRRTEEELQGFDCRPHLPQLLTHIVLLKNTLYWPRGGRLEPHFPGEEAGLSQTGRVFESRRWNWRCLEIGWTRCTWVRVMGGRKGNQTEGRRRGPADIVLALGGHG